VYKSRRRSSRGMSALQATENGLRRREVIRVGRVDHDVRRSRSVLERLDVVERAEHRLDAELRLELMGLCRVARVRGKLKGGSLRMSEKTVEDRAANVAGGPSDEDTKGSA
jgi:hypothetical protein